MRTHVWFFVVICFASSFGSNTNAARFLFDVDHAQTAGNADWVICYSGGTYPQVPVPAQSGITSSTTESYWTGALSAWGVDLVKRGHSVAQLTSGASISYGGAASSDLSKFDVFVSDEPNTAFTTSEKQAILNFVSNGGSLFLISDHAGSDRNNDGCDSVCVWNGFLTNNGLTNNPFGVTFRTTGTGSNSSGQNTYYRTDPADPICNGPLGTSTAILYSNGDEFQLDPTKNPTLLAHLWFGASSDSNNYCAVATCLYGSGRVVICGDSSPFDDGTGDHGTLYTGYTGDIGGAHRPLILNCSEWLAAPFASSPLLVGVTNVTPSCGSTAGGTAVTITGSNFVSGATVTIGGSSATSVVVVNSNTVTAVTPANTAGAKIVQVTNTGGNFGALTNGFTYNVPPSPSNNGPICSGQTLNLFANTNAASYSWTGPNSFTSTAQNPTITNVTSSAAGTYVLSVGCSSATGVTTVTVNALPTVRTVTGGGAFCAGGSGAAVGLNGSDSGIRYQLVRNSTTNVGSPVVGSGSVISFGNQTVAGTYTVTASNATTSCTVAMTGSATVTVNPLPTVTTTPAISTNICNGSSVTLTAAGASTYGWSPATGLDTTSGATVHASPTNTTTYTVTGTDGNGCQNSTNVTVIINPLPACNVSPLTATTCVGNLQVLTANPSGGTGPYTYGWTGPNGHTGNAVSITVSNAQPADAGSYSVIVTDAKGCSTSCSATLAIDTSGIPAGSTITIPSGGFCVNATNAPTFTVAGTADTNVAVRIYANAVLVGTTTADGAGNWSTNLNLTLLADGPVSFTATATNNCYSSGSSSAVSGQKDATAPTFAGLGAVAPFTEGATLTWAAAVDSNAVSYQVFQATVSGGENFGAPALTTNSLSVFFAPLYPGSNSPITYFYIVRATDSCGNTDTNTVEQSVQPLLDPAKNQNGDGIPNGWKQQYGIDPFDPNAANADPDGDGMSNLQEFLAGTDPTNSASAFSITAVTPSGNDLIVTWTAGTGRTNALQRTTGDANGAYVANSFADIFTVTNAVGGGTNFPDLGAATNFPSLYYRVRLVP